MFIYYIVQLDNDNNCLTIIIILLHNVDETKCCFASSGRIINNNIFILRVRSRRSDDSVVVVVFVLRSGATAPERPHLVHHVQPAAQVVVEPGRGHAVPVQHRVVVRVHLLAGHSGRRYRHAYRRRRVPRGQRLALAAPRRRVTVPQLVVDGYEQRREHGERNERHAADQQRVLERHEHYRPDPKIHEELVQHVIRQLFESLKRHTSILLF